MILWLFTYNDARVELNNNDLNCDGKQRFFFVNKYTLKIQDL